MHTGECILCVCLSAPTFDTIPEHIVHARAVHGRYIRATKVKALPESLGQCKLFISLCVPPPPPRRERVRLCRSKWGCCGRLPERWAVVQGRARRCDAAGRGLPSRAAPWRVCTGADRDASRTELAALPAAVEWPDLTTLCAPPPRRAPSAAAA